MIPASFSTPSRTGVPAIGPSNSVQATLSKTTPVPFLANEAVSAQVNTVASITSVTAATISVDNLNKAVKQINESFTQKGQSLYASFEKDVSSGIDIVKIVDKKTNELIRQMPPKEIVALAQFLAQSEGTRGKFINATA
jgi:flagellar protein FlaG